MAKYELTKDAEEYVRRQLSDWYDEAKDKFDRWYEDKSNDIEREYNDKMRYADEDEIEQIEKEYDDKMYRLDSEYDDGKSKLSSAYSNLSSFAEHRIFDRYYDHEPYIVDWNHYAVLPAAGQGFSIEFSYYDVQLTYLLDARLEIGPLGLDDVNDVELESERQL